MRLLIGCTVLIAFGSVRSASATQTLFPITSCAGCTAVQMQAKAKNSFPLGIGFVYDLHSHVIRKYEVYMDSTCGAQPLPQTHSGMGQQTQDAGAGGIDCGSFKAADEMTPVDSSVQAPFDALWRVDSYKPALAENGIERTYGVVLNSHGQPFDLQRVAWDYPNGTYVDYANAVSNLLSNKNNANDLDLYLGDFLYDYRWESFHVEVSIPPEISGGLSWDRNGAIELYICTMPADDCSAWTVTVNNGVLTKTFQAIYDYDNNIYPNANGQMPGNLTNWGFRYGGQAGANHFAEEMRNNGVYIPSSGYCGFGTHPFLTTTRMNNQIIFQSWSCVQN